MIRRAVPLTLSACLAASLLAGCAHEAPPPPPAPPPAAQPAPAAPGAQGSIGQRIAAKFKAADTSGDGQLSREEMQAGMPRLAAHFDEIDADHDGQVTPAELKAYLQARRGSGG